MRSDADGRFALAQVPSGLWAIRLDSDALPRAMTFFEIAPTERSKLIDIAIDRGLAISGRVLDPDGNPVPGCSVSGQSDVRHPWGNRDGAEAAPDGSFLLGPLLSGRYRLQAWDQNSPFFVPSEETEASTGERDITLQLRWGGILRGRVVDAETEQPCAARLSLVSKEYDFNWGNGSEDDGTFEFTNLEPGLYDLVADPHDGRIGILSGLRVAAKTVLGDLRLRLSEGAELKVRLHSRESSQDWRFEVLWEGVRILDPYGYVDNESERMLHVPLGEITVQWMGVEVQDGRQTWILEHEDRVHVTSIQTDYTVEYVLPE